MFLAKTLGKALLCQKSTLRVLDLDIDAYLPDRDGDEFTNDLQRQDEEQENLELMPADWKIDQAESSGPLWLWDIADTRHYGLTIGSLHDFQTLAHLSIGIILLLGPGPNSLSRDRNQKEPPYRLVDALPPSLEFLRIRGYRAGENSVYDSHMQELMDRKSEKLPRLSTVEGYSQEIPSAVIYTNARVDKSLLWKEDKIAEGLEEGLVHDKL